MTVHLSLLGPPVVTRDGEPLSFDTRKATALLGVLAVEGKPQPRDRLAALLWPDAEPTRARSALRRTLSVTAAAVGDALVAARSVVGLDPDRTSSDVAEFDALAAAGDRDSLRAATALYRDDFLAGFGLRDAPEFEDWQAQVGDALRRRLGAALARLVDTGIAAGDLDGATADAERWLALDPLHEAAHCALIRLHAWRGDRSAAMRQYRTCVRILDAELGVEPLQETTQLYDAVRRDALPPPEVTLAPAPPPNPPTTDDRADRPLVGRTAEEATLAQAVRRAADGHGVVVAVVGGTGAGKTTLLRRATRLVPAGPVVVAVRCHPEESALAYGGAIELLRGLLTAAPQLLDRLPRHARAELARLLPETAELDGPAAAGDDPAAVARLYATVREVIVAGGPVVLVVDDAQCLDAASADLLAYLVRRVTTTPLALLLAVATDAASAPPALIGAVGDAVADGDGVELRLRPLDEPAVTELVRGDPAVANIDVGRLLADTGGVPALVTAWLDAVRRGDDPYADTATAVHETLARRVSTLSQTAQQVLAAAAVIGGRIDPDVLRETSGRGDAETVAAVEEALRAGLLVELPGGDGYDVPLEMLRRVVLSATTVARRRLLHERAAHALTRRVGSGRLTPADAGAIAHHLREAGRDGAAAEWHWRAAVEARALHAHEQALADVRAALTLGFAPTPARLAEGEILIALGRYREAITALELAAAAAEPATPDAVRIEQRLADVHHRLGDYPVADVHLTAALEQSDGIVADDEVATMLAERALVALRRDALDDASRLAADALAVARRAGAAAPLANALNVSGVLAARSGDGEAAERSFRESVAAAERAASPDAAIAALNNLARLLSRSGRHDEALAIGLDALARGEQVGDRHRLAALHTNLADLLRATHQDERAIDHLKQAASLFAAVDDEAQRRPEIWKLVEW